VKYKETQNRKMAILRAISKGDYMNKNIAKELGLTSQKISYDKQTLYKDDFIDRGFDNQVWVLTEIGENALKYGIELLVPTEDRKLEVLYHLYNTTEPLYKINSNSDYQYNPYSYHKKWLKHNGFVTKGQGRGKLTEKGIKALKDKSIAKYMEV